MEAKYCVYLHLNSQTQEPFYVGIGTIKRPYDFIQSRSNFWKNYVKKYGTPFVWIIITGVDRPTAEIYEKDLIAHYGRRDNKTGTLVNQTDGGDGTAGRKLTSIQIEHLRKRMLQNNPAKRNDVRQTISLKTREAVRNSDTRAKFLQMVSSDEFRKKVSIGTKKALENPATKQKLVAATKAAWTTERKAACTGVGNHKSKPVNQLKDGIIVATYSNAYEAQRITGIKAGNINMVVRGHRKTTKGFEWKYAS